MERTENEDSEIEERERRIFAEYPVPKAVAGFSAVCTLAFSLLCSIGSYVFARRLIGFFIKDAATISYGMEFLRVLCIAVSIYPLLFIIIAVFQAVGQHIKPFVLSLLHKGSLDIVLFFLIRKIFGPESVLWASPVMEAVALTMGIIWILRWFRFQNRPQEG